jgi:hypothetical protein
MVAPSKDEMWGARSKKGACIVMFGGSTGAVAKWVNEVEWVWVEAVAGEGGDSSYIVIISDSIQVLRSSQNSPL